MAFADGSITSHDNLVKALKQGYQSIGINRGRTTLVRIQNMMTADGVITESVNEHNVSVYHYNPQRINVQSISEESCLHCGDAHD